MKMCDIYFRDSGSIHEAKLNSKPLGSTRAKKLAAGKMSSLKEVFDSHAGYYQHGSFSKNSKSSLMSKETGRWVQIIIREVKED